MCRSVWLPVCLSACRSVCLRLSARLYVCVGLSVCLCFVTHVCRSVSLFSVLILQLYIFREFMIFCRLLRTCIMLCVCRLSVTGNFNKVGSTYCSMQYELVRCTYYIPAKALLQLLFISLPP